MGQAGEVTPKSSVPVELEWSDWQALAGVEKLTAGVVSEILDGGQAFRWNRLAGTKEGWQGIFGRCLVRLKLSEAGRLEWCAPREIAARTDGALARYFAVTPRAREWVDLLPWRSDPHLSACLQGFPGLRILRQPFGETLLGFLCSATKQIVQIKQMLALLAERHGAPILREFPAWKQLPTWDAIAGLAESDLRACLLGFRARYIHGTAQFLAAHPGWLEATEKMEYAEAKARLTLLPGVGEKIADCVLLFGAGRLEAFPVDVWILKTMALRYGLEDWKPGQLAQFGRVHYGPLAGLAQQYLFAYERGTAAEKRKPPAVIKSAG